MRKSVVRVSATPFAQIDELSAQAIEAEKLRDEIDEYRHAADKLAKAENTLEKYKKKLEEAADVRRALKVRCHAAFAARFVLLTPV